MIYATINRHFSISCLVVARKSVWYQKIIEKLVYSVLLLAVVVVPVAASADVEKQYRKQCGVCHGDDGDGRGRAGVSLSPPATSFISPELKSRLSTDYVARIIREGKPGTAMVGYARRLTEIQIQDLAIYIDTRFVHPQQHSTRKISGIDGKQIYIKNCSACHGDNGNTAVWARNGLSPPPRNFTSEAAKQELSLERMITSVSYGRPGTAMMPFTSRLSAAEIRAVVAFIRKEFMGIRTDLPITQIQVQPESSTQVDIEWGRNFYMNNCFTCHGKKGDGKGPRAYFNQPRPRDFTSQDTAKRFDRPKLIAAIKSGKTGSVMPAWSTVLSDNQIASVAEFVYQQFIVEKKN